MEPAPPYQREHYRLPLSVTYPAMYFDRTRIGEGIVTNLSVFGCAIQCAGAVPDKTTLLVRLLLPDRKESLAIEQAEVRWVKGNRVGLQFGKLERDADLRLHTFVWDRMLERMKMLTR
ncbi:MAG: PilZ domain-containing protein [Nitrospira sp.]|nr:PilZ domain-containing protein [Nitrospira sp.]